MNFRTLKLRVFATANGLGVSRVVLNSAWRKSKLLILCWHGFSVVDEHEWNPAFYMQPELVRHRLELLNHLGCNVLLLDEALQRLYAGTLPRRAVALTVDDGSYDFYRFGFPLFCTFGFPITLYYTTWYAEFQRPVFDTMCSYLVWKAAKMGRTAVQLPDVLDGPADLSTSESRQQLVRQILSHATQNHWSGKRKDEMLNRLACELKISYEELLARRTLQLARLEEVRDMVRQGLDVQYHTHRHRMYREPELLKEELDDNRERILKVTSKEPKHFCYTGGLTLPEYGTYLRSWGLRSATTCEPGLCSCASDPMYLPRLLDMTTLRDTDIEAWVAGYPELLPKARYSYGEGQLVNADWRDRSRSVGSA